MVRASTNALWYTSVWKTQEQFYLLLYLFLFYIYFITFVVTESIDMVECLVNN